MNHLVLLSLWDSIRDVNDVWQLFFVPLWCSSWLSLPLESVGCTKTTLNEPFLAQLSRAKIGRKCFDFSESGEWVSSTVIFRPSVVLPFLCGSSKIKKSGSNWQIDAEIRTAGPRTGLPPYFPGGPAICHPNQALLPWCRGFGQGIRRSIFPHALVPLFSGISSSSVFIKRVEGEAT